MHLKVGDVSGAVPFRGRTHAALVKIFLGFSPSRSVNHLQKVMFRHWVPYTLNHPLVSAFSHETPLSASHLIRLPLALYYLPVQLLQLFVHLDLAEWGSCIVILALPNPM